MIPNLPKIAFVVATKDRPRDLRNMLASLAGQSVRPGQVVIVDASAKPVESVVAEFPSLRIDYLRHLPPLASAQRNAGIQAVAPAMDLVGFLDDDAVRKISRALRNAERQAGLRGNLTRQGQKSRVRPFRQSIYSRQKAGLSDTGLVGEGTGRNGESAEPMSVLTWPIRRFRRAFVRYPRRCLVRWQLRRILLAAPLYEDVHSPTLVVAPHPDDEVLGAGGLIASIRAAGGRVTALFLTRGETAHRSCCGLAPEAVAAERTKLAIEADAMLGVGPGDILWADLPCQRIPTVGEARFTAAVEGVSLVLRNLQPRTVVYPHKLDCWPDHVAAAHICERAIAVALPDCRQVRYLVWAWYSLAVSGLRELVVEEARSVSFAALADRKRQAISHYLNAIAPCGESYCGRLPRGFMSPFLAEDELVLVRESAER